MKITSTDRLLNLMTSSAVPERYASQPGLVIAIIDARKVQMETEDTPFAIEWLMEHYPMSLASAEKALNDETFRYKGLYPDGHPGLDAMLAEQRAKGRRAYQLTKLRPQIIDRDDSRCQGCNKRVAGRDATLDHKDPEGPATLDNVHLLCQRCNTVKGKGTWEEFQQERARVESAQAARPDFICEQTGLSVRGRSWKEAGCFNPSSCRSVSSCVASKSLGEESIKEGDNEW